MSELRVALIAEGPTDAVIIEAALKAILSEPFTLAVLQPEPTRPQLGTGWCGVFNWCREFGGRAQPELEADPTLPGFDLFVIHVDADVADKSYADGGPAVESAAVGMPLLPCAQPCPPAAGSADEMRVRLLAWLGLARVKPRTVLCVPSKSTESWLAAGVLNAPHTLLGGVECDLALERRLAALPIERRIRKKAREYVAHAPTVTRKWGFVSAKCSQAERFGKEVLAVFAVPAAALPP